MSRRKPPTQEERVARVLRRHGRTSQLDWDSPTIDGAPPVRRLASRVADLRSRGWRIDSSGRYKGMALYKLISAPASPAHAAEDAFTRPETLLPPDAGSAPPLSPYDAEAEA